MVMGAETSADRFAACKSMLDYGFANYALVEPRMQENASVPVILGKEESVRAVPAEAVQLLIDKAQRGSVTTDIALDPEVTAPVSQGQRLGTLTVRSGEQILAQIPLVAQQGIPRKTWGDIFLQLLRKITMAKDR